MQADFNSVGAGMRAHIAAALDDVARAEDVTILYAAESGSRAWGFASPDSDYDVRFIYDHRWDWYTTLNEARDVIERPLDSALVDLAGWDVRKALRLLLKSNPALYEWFSSPIVYAETGSFRFEAKSLFERHASPRVLANAYHSIASSQFPEDAAGRDGVKLKRYFYLIRPLLSLKWVVERGTLPPMNLGQLLERVAVPADVLDALRTLLQQKRSAPELGSGSRIFVIDDWARTELAALAPSRLDLVDRDTAETREAADRLFRETVGF